MTDEATKDNEDFVQYTCHPIRKLSFGREYRFENGIMQIRPDQVEAFEAVLEGADARTKYQVKKIDSAAAEKVIAQLIQSGATKSIDSAASAEGKQATLVGTEAIDAPKPVTALK
jgi:hypothetical protein